MENSCYVEYKWLDKPDSCAHRYIVSAIIQELKEINLSLDSYILDAGCGGGSLVNSLYALGFVNTWGFDLSGSGVDIAKRVFPELADRFFKHNAYEAKLPEAHPQTYDLVLSTEVIEHLYSPQIYLQNLYSWLNKDGYLIVTTPYHGYLKNATISLMNRFNRHFDPLSESGHIKFFSKKTLSFLLNKEKFDIVKFRGVGRIPYLWKSMILVAKKIE